jgi:hypothetical protein
MPRQKAPAPLYSVYVTAYISDEVKQAVESGIDRIRGPEQLETLSFYLGTSKAQAERAFSRAAIAAYNNPRAYMVTLNRDREALARMRVERY